MRLASFGVESSRAVNVSNVLIIMHAAKCRSGDTSRHQAREHLARAMVYVELLACPGGKLCL